MATRISALETRAGASIFDRVVVSGLGSLAAPVDVKLWGPFTTRGVADRFGLGRAVVDETLQRLAAASRVLEGEFRPGGTEREWCEPGVLSQIRRRSLA